MSIFPSRLPPRKAQHRVNEGSVTVSRRSLRPVWLPGSIEALSSPVGFAGCRRARYFASHPSRSSRRRRAAASPTTTRPPPAPIKIQLVVLIGGELGPGVKVGEVGGPCVLVFLGTLKVGFGVRDGSERS